MIALLPRKGIGDLNFGDSQAMAIEQFGDGYERDHPTNDQYLKSIQYPSIGLTLYFSEEDRLVTAIGDGDSSDLSLMGQLLSTIFGDSPNPDRIKGWISSHGFTTGEPRSFLDCWHYEVENEDFSFALDEEGVGGVELRVGT